MFLLSLLGREKDFLTRYEFRNLREGNITTKPQRVINSARAGSYQIKTNPQWFCNLARAGSYQIKTLSKNTKDSSFVLCSFLSRKRARRNKKAAFTLAEVLITLAIIGVIAALTIPNLIQQHQKNATVSRLQKTYSVLKNAVAQGEKENGPLITHDLVKPNRAYMRSLAWEYFLPYLKIKTDCTKDANNSKCTQITRPDLEGNSPNYNSLTTTSGVAFVLEDNSFVCLFPTTPTNQIILIEIDTNGAAGPNKRGKDVFWLILALRPQDMYWLKGKEGLWLWGSGNTRNNLIGGSDCCIKGKCAQSGGKCSALIMVDGWKISKDYPW